MCVGGMKFGFIISQEIHRNKNHFLFHFHIVLEIDLNFARNFFC